jgi:hypothetical protein
MLKTIIDQGSVEVDVGTDVKLPTKIKPQGIYLLQQVYRYKQRIETR